MDKTLDHLCRLCGEERKCSFNVFIKTEDDVLLCDIIKDSLNISISETDTIPTDLCSMCNSFILNFIKFRDVAEKTQLFLADLQVNLEKEKAAEEATAAAVAAEAAARAKERCASVDSIKLEESGLSDFHEAGPPSHHSFSSDDDNIPLKEVATIETLPKKRRKVRKRLKEIPKEETGAKIKSENEERSVKKEKKQMDGEYFEHSVEFSIESPLDNPEECNICHKRFTKERYLRLHLRLTHKIIIESKYPCDRCTRKFMQKESYEKHMKLHDDPDFNKPVPCNICNKVYSNKQTLKAHIRTIHMDDGERKFVCEECGAVFKAISSLKAHQVSHTGEFPYECSKCERRFQTKTNLLIHMDIHSETPYICTICRSQSTTLRGLRLHMIKHSDRKPHQCPMCGNSYKRVTALKKHLIVHSGIKPYSCNFCERTFADGSNKRIHMKRVHKKELAEMEASGLRFTPTTLPKLQQLKEDGVTIRG